MELQFIHDYLQDPALRRSFNALAGEVFGLDFEPWYQRGWSGKYHPYSCLVDGQVAANVSANRIDCLLAGQERHYVQLGTVMTLPAHRNRGLCRRLMEQVLSDWADCDGIFLYANDSVLDFYPRFGFRSAVERRWRTALAGAEKARVRPVAMETPEDWRRFLEEKNRRTSAGLLQLDTDGLMMFYLSGPMRRSVFALPEDGAYVVAELEGGTLRVYDVFSSGPTDLLEVCRAFGPQVRQVEFAFTPAEREGLEVRPYREEDTTLFLLGQGLAADLERFGGFPELAHA